MFIIVFDFFLVIAKLLLMSTVYYDMIIKQYIFKIKSSLLIIYYDVFCA